MPNIEHLIPEKNIARHGPKRLKAMNGQRLDPKTRQWKPFRARAKPAAEPNAGEIVRTLKEGRAKPVIETRAIAIARIRPLTGHIICREGAEIAQEKGVTIPEAHRQRSDDLPVVAVGTGVRDIAPGDAIRINRNARPKGFQLGGQSYLVIRAKDAVLKVLP